MVAKGHHFAGVALAAVVDADTGLAMPDFRAEERTFQLVTQLAGRSGRTAPGRVIVQTFQPDSRAVVFAARHDVAGFLAEELRRREELGYPPLPARRARPRLGPESRTIRAGCWRRSATGSATPTRSARRHCSACGAATARS